MRLEQLVKNIQNALVYTDFNFLPLKWVNSASWCQSGGEKIKFNIRAMINFPKSCLVLVEHGYNIHQFTFIVGVEFMDFFTS